jgi:ubiquinone/menaquinone biosynthesis C-methylase UbiE
MLIGSEIDELKYNMRVSFTKKVLQIIQHVLRHAYLLKAAEYLRYLKRVLQCRRRNRTFRKDYPAFKLPPQHLAYDAYASPDWYYYRRTGLQVAQDVARLLLKYNYDISSINILEWGCGPGRVIRHFPSVLGPSARVYGTDYNEETIDWAKANIDGVKFMKNGLKPPLSFDDNSFDFVCALSVLTHLSEASCLQWIKEIARVLKNDGMLCFTTNSDIIAKILLSHEKKIYDTKGFYCRGKIQEGKKMFNAFHSRPYVRQTMIKDFELLQHTTSGLFQFIPTQDTWLVRKKKKGAPTKGPHEDR